MKLLTFKQSDYYKRKKDRLSTASPKAQKFYADCHDLAEQILKGMTFNVEVIPADDVHYILRTPKINLDKTGHAFPFTLGEEKKCNPYLLFCFHIHPY